MIAASYWGKFKTTFQMVMVCLMIADIPQLQLLTDIIMWIALLLTVISLVDYRKFASADFLEKVYGGERVTLIRDILENANFSEDERSEILALVNTAE